MGCLLNDMEPLCSQLDVGQNQWKKIFKKDELMSIKRILVNTIDTNLEYEVIGIDLAKSCVSAILLIANGEIFGIDRLGYQELEESAQKLSPTIFAMEPCTEMNYMVKKFEEWEHHWIVISGKNVKDHVESHFSNQKPI